MSYLVCTLLVSKQELKERKSLAQGLQKPRTSPASTGCWLHPSKDFLACVGPHPWNFLPISVHGKPTLLKFRHEMKLLFSLHLTAGIGSCFGFSVAAFPFPHLSFNFILTIFYIKYLYIFIYWMEVRHCKNWQL